MRLSRETLVTGCAVLALMTMVQISLIAFNYSANLNYDVPKSGNYDQVDQSVLVQLREKRLPSALIIGVRKGGTRALLDALALHPSIKSARREMHFFNQNETYAKGTDWYREQMPFVYPHQLTIEKTPGYFTNEFAPERVHKLNEKMRIIVILRNPVMRTISDFTQVYYNKVELNKTLPVFEDVVFQNASGRINTDYKPVRNSLYVDHLKNWLKYFPLEQFLFLDGETFVTDPLSQLRLAESFLDLPHVISSSQLVWDQNKGFHCFRKKMDGPAKCLGTTKGRAHRPVNEKTRQKLRSQFRPYNRKMFSLLNRHFHW